VEAKEYLLSSIEKAEKGIRAFNIRPRYLHILKRRVEKRKTSADIVKRWFRRGDSEEERIAYLVNRVWEHTRKNKCII